MKNLVPFFVADRAQQRRQVVGVGQAVADQQHAPETVFEDACRDQQTRDKIRTEMQSIAAVLRTLADKDVTLHADERATALAGDVETKPVSDEAWNTEFHDLEMSVGVVDSLDEAIEHIDGYSTHHTDCIVTENRAAARTFIAQVDSAVVMVNASTRFTDGGEFGFGAEIGISTQKLHARGPMALAELTTTKWIVDGDGQIR